MIKKFIGFLLAVVILLSSTFSAGAILHESYYLVGGKYKITYAAPFMRNLVTGDYYYCEPNQYSSTHLDNNEWTLWKIPDDYYADLEYQKLKIGDKEYDLIVNDEIQEAYYNGEKDEEISALIQQAWQALETDSQDGIFVFKIKFESVPNYAYEDQESTILKANVYCLGYRFDRLDLECIYPQELNFSRFDNLVNVDYYKVNYTIGNLDFETGVNMKDVVTLQRYIANFDEKINIITADANLDGYIDMQDVVAIQRIIADL